MIAADMTRRCPDAREIGVVELPGWRVVVGRKGYATVVPDPDGRVIVEGFTTASLGAPGRGTYSVSASYTAPAETVAFIEVFSRSAKDGSIDEIVRIPVTLR